MLYDVLADDSGWIAWTPEGFICSKCFVRLLVKDLPRVHVMCSNLSKRLHTQDPSIIAGPRQWVLVGPATSSVLQVAFGLGLPLSQLLSHSTWTLLMWQILLIDDHSDLEENSVSQKWQLTLAWQFLSSLFVATEAVPSLSTVSGMGIFWVSSNNRRIKVKWINI